MSTITSLGASDTGSVSRGVINTNFTNLNTDKIEANDVKTLTNKTIDGDNNTIQDLPYSSIKSTQRTGLDAFIVTGTKGDNGELAKWNSDGDLVTTDVSITTTTPSSSSDNTTIPTSAAVHAAVNAAAASKQFFVPVLKHSADAEPYDATVVGDFAFSQLDTSESAYLAFCVPSDFTSLTSVELIMLPDATESVQFDVATDIAASGEAYNIHSGAASNVSQSVTANTIAKVRIDAVSGLPFAAMAANDVVGVAITSDITMIRVIGILVKYA